MTPLQTVIWSLAMTALVLLLVGLFRRGRHRACYSFTAYAFAVLIGSILPRIDPDRFFNWDFYLPRDAVLALLKVAIGVELARRIFRSFPGAFARARWVILVVLAGLLLAVTVVSTTVADSGSLYSRLMPRVQNGTAWLFTSILGVVLWYRLPLNLFHKAILVGFVPYLLIATAAVQAMETWGWREMRIYAGYIDSVAYLLCVAYWAYAAWRPVIPTVSESPKNGGLEGWLG
jgi:hypothetical protein